MTRARQALGFVFLAAGAIGWMGALLDTVSVGWSRLRYERPLTELLGIAVDSQGRIYTGTPPYGRIQAYSAQGRFLSSWYYPGTEEFRLRVNAHDQLEVADSNRTRQGDLTDTLTTYDSSGEILRREEADGAWARFGSESETIFRLPSGEVLAIVDRRWYPRIVRRSTSGEVSVVIKNSWVRWFLAAPLPTWFWFAFGLLLLGIVQKALERGRHDGPGAPTG